MSLKFTITSDDPLAPGLVRHYAELVRQRTADEGAVDWDHVNKLKKLADHMDTLERVRKQEA